MKNKILLSVATCCALAQVAASENTILLDSVSVTATKIKKETKDVPQSIAVVNQNAIEEKELLNVTKAIEDIPGVQSVQDSGGYSSRLVIRGAGLKARYGIREIMVMRDGVPMTDPDSFTRLDYIDMQDIEQIEVSKGPGSIYNSNTTGGVVHIISKSVFDENKNRIKFGAGEKGTFNFNARAGGAINNSDTDYISATLSHRRSKNDWREWNEFDTTQMSLKYGHLFEDDSSIESEFSYSEANLQLAGSMNEEEFQTYLDTGNIKNPSSPWQKSGRYSKIYFFNTKYEKEYQDFVFKPRIYINKWEHFHPVTGIINDSDDNIVMGTDLELSHSHSLFGQNGALVFGITGRMDRSKDSKKYKYADYTAGFGGRITEVTSDRRGELASIKDSKTSLYGVYMQENIELLNNLSMDVGFRFERLDFDVTGNEISRYDYASGKYVAGDSLYSFDESYNLFSPKIGFSYAIDSALNIYASIARGQQAPTESEISANRSIGLSTSLNPSSSINYETGIKNRTDFLSFDITYYITKTDDELVSYKYNVDETAYQNAGKTTKQGVEVSLNYLLGHGFDIGADYAYSHYKYDDYIDGSSDYSGKYFKYIPAHKYSLSLGYKHPTGIKARIQGRSWGSYYMDDANTKKYGGYDFVTDLMLGYVKKNHNIQLNITNLFDKRYSVESERGDYNKYTKTYKESYSPAQPRIAMLTYTYSF